MSDALAKICAQDVMSDRIIILKEGDSLTTVMTLFERCGISGAPVQNEYGKWVGVVTTSDFAGTKMMRLMRSGRSPDNIVVKMIMTPTKPLAVFEHTPLIEVMDQMLSCKVHRLFVQNEAYELVGVITTSDVMKAVMRAPAGNDHYVSGLLEDSQMPASKRHRLIKIHDMVTKKHAEMQTSFERVAF